jgi:inner membrane protein
MVTNEVLLGRVMIFAVFAWAVLDIIKLNPGIDGVFHYILPVIFGYLSHIVGDCMTPAGVRAFYPISNYKLKKKEAFILVVLWASVAFYIWRDVILF